MSDVLALRDHPLLVVEKIIARRGPDLTFTYSRYQIAPPGLQASARRTDPPFRVPARDVSRDWLVDRLAELAPDEEIAWHSYVETPVGALHIPMIDFVGRHDVSVLRDVARAILSGMQIVDDFQLFETGQSHHGYFIDLIPQRAWATFLGRLLLLNASDQPPVVDDRWVGHALVRGFAALRWSHNTSRYRAMPALVAQEARELAGGSR